MLVVLLVVDLVAPLPPLEGGVDFVAILLLSIDKTNVELTFCFTEPKAGDIFFIIMFVTCYPKESNPEKWL